MSNSSSATVVGTQQQTFTVSLGKSWVAKHPEFAHFFTRTKELGGRLDPRMMADFDNFADAYELLCKLRTLGLPVFKNFAT